LSHTAEPSLAGARARQDKLVRDHQHLVRAVVRPLERRYAGLVAAADLEQAAHLGLLEAARTYRADLGYLFAGYAWKIVYGHAMQVVRGEARFRSRARELAAAALALSVREGDPLATEPPAAKAELGRHAARAAAAVLLGLGSSRSAGIDGADDGGSERRALCAQVKGALGELEAEQRRLLELHYFEGQELRRIAATLNVAYNTVRRRRNAALEALRIRICDPSAR
jgi:RNA polymerase sigma factor (sigma-70 family)